MERDPQWSRERADEIEAMLLKIMAQFKEAVDPHGCSYEGYRDYKVHFGLSDTNPLHGYFLSYVPTRREFECWAGGLGYMFPLKRMENILRGLFPNLYHYKTRGSGIDGFHHWRGVTEEQLRKAVAKL